MNMSTRILLHRTEPARSCEPGNTCIRTRFTRHLSSSRLSCLEQIGQLGSWPSDRKCSSSGGAGTDALAEEIPRRLLPCKSSDSGLATG